MWLPCQLRNDQQPSREHGPGLRPITYTWCQVGWEICGAARVIVHALEQETLEGVSFICLHIQSHNIFRSVLVQVQKRP